VSYTSTAQLGQLTDDALEPRTVAEIQRQAIDYGGRRLASRLFHSRGDKEKINGWALEITTILHVFNVRSVHFSLTVANRLVSRPSWR
jgi:hypothetical protein